MPAPDWFPEWFQQLGLMAWPLAACSVLALALGLERTVFAIRAGWQREANYRRLADHLTRHRGKPKALRDDLSGVLLRELQGNYYSGIAGLRIIGAMSPMLGLLGTILGIIAAFQAISVQAGPVSPSVIADGLWEAMLTTAVGLLIALPSLLLAHLFKWFSERQLDDFCLRLNKLSLSFELDEPLGALEAAPDRPDSKPGQLAA